MEIKKNTELRKYFDAIFSKISSQKIIGVYSVNPWFNTDYGYSGMLDLPLFIIFADNNCLVIEYPFINSLSIEYRSMNEEENKEYLEDKHKDLLNSEYLIYTKDEPSYSLKIEFPYGQIKDITIVPVKEKYSAWINGDLDFIEPTEETFNEIIFTLDNGKKFSVSADDAEVDGYTNFFTDDATITQGDKQLKKRTDIR